MQRLYLGAEGSRLRGSCEVCQHSWLFPFPAFMSVFRFSEGSVGARWQGWLTAYSVYGVLDCISPNCFAKRGLGKYDIQKFAIANLLGCGLFFNNTKSIIFRMGVRPCSRSVVSGHNCPKITWNMLQSAHSDYIGKENHVFDAHSDVLFAELESVLAIT